MGIKGFSKTFEPKIVKWKDLKNLSMAIDASVVLYKASLGAASIKTLTDNSDNPTLHLSVITAKVLNFAKCNIDQLWVFDYHEDGYVSPDKELEIAKRKKKRAEAKKKLKELKQTQKQTQSDIKRQREDELFSSSDEDDDDPKGKASKEALEKKICQKEKECFTMDAQIVNDCKFILDCLDVTWTTAPKDIEAEQVCADLTNGDELDLDFGCDAVYSTDVDALLYGAQQLIRDIKSKNKKVLQCYDLEAILENNELEMSDLIKASIILGSDHAPKTPGVGPKTVLKKLDAIELTEDQQKATKVFDKSLDVSKLKYSNEFGDVDVAQDKVKINKLIDWLVNVKGFNKARITKQIMKVYDGDL